MLSLGITWFIQTSDNKNYSEYWVKYGNCSTVFLPDGSWIVIDYSSDIPSVMLVNHKREKIIYHRVLNEESETTQHDLVHEIAYTDFEGNGLPSMKTETIQIDGVVKTKIYDIEHKMILKKELPSVEINRKEP